MKDGKLNRRDAKNAEKRVFSLAGERPAREKLRCPLGKLD